MKIRLLIICLLVSFSAVLADSGRKKTRMYGARNGKQFSSTCNVLSEIRLYFDSSIIGVQPVCEGGKSNKLKGGMHGSLYKFQLKKGEFITKINGTFSSSKEDEISSLEFVTNLGTSPVYGKKKDRAFSISIPENARLVGFSGRYSPRFIKEKAVDEIVAIGGVYILQP
ncbi:MAG: hypothetical protein KDK38_00345 [Leptospiraceae bacterium]|nr:hypothetical protein [Leptospiraceae bacterium]